MRRELALDSKSWTLMHGPESEHGHLWEACVRQALDLRGMHVGGVRPAAMRHIHLSTSYS